MLNPHKQRVFFLHITEAEEARFSPVCSLGVTGAGSRSSMWVVVKIRIPFRGALNIRCRIILGIQKGVSENRGP